MFTPRAMRENSVKTADNELLIDFFMASAMLIEQTNDEKYKEEYRFNVQLCRKEILRRMKEDK